MVLNEGDESYHGLMFFSNNKVTHQHGMAIDKK